MLYLTFVPSGKPPAFGQPPPTWACWLNPAKPACLRRQGTPRFGKSCAAARVQSIVGHVEQHTGNAVLKRALDVCAFLRQVRGARAVLLFAVSTAPICAVSLHTLVPRARLLDRLALWPGEEEAHRTGSDTRGPLGDGI